MDSSTHPVRAKRWLLLGLLSLGFVLLTGCKAQVIITHDREPARIQDTNSPVNPIPMLLTVTNWQLVWVTNTVIMPTNLSCPVVVTSVPFSFPEKSISVIFTNSPPVTNFINLTNYLISTNGNRGDSASSNDSEHAKFVISLAAFIVSAFAFGVSLWVFQRNEKWKGRDAQSKTREKRNEARSRTAETAGRANYLLAKLERLKATLTERQIAGTINPNNTARAQELAKKLDEGIRFCGGVDSLSFHDLATLNDDQEMSRMKLEFFEDLIGKRQPTVELLKSYELKVSEFEAHLNAL